MEHNEMLIQETINYWRAQLGQCHDYQELMVILENLHEAESSSVEAVQH